MTNPETLLEQVVKSMVDDTEAVQIDGNVTNHSAVFDIKVADKDVSKMLGKRGAHAEALRTVFSAVYGKLGKRLHLQVVTPKR